MWFGADRDEQTTNSGLKRVKPPPSLQGSGFDHTGLSVGQKDEGETQLLCASLSAPWRALLAEVSLA